MSASSPQPSLGIRTHTTTLPARPRWINQRPRKQYGDYRCLRTYPAVRNLLPPDRHTHSPLTPYPPNSPVFPLSSTMKLTSLLVLAGLPAGSAFVAPAKVFHGAGVGAARGSTERSTASCQMMARVPFIAGNWKMNPLDLGTAKDLAKAVSCACVLRFGLWGVVDERGEEELPLLLHTHGVTCAARQMPPCCSPRKIGQEHVSSFGGVGLTICVCYGRGLGGM